MLNNNFSLNPSKKYRLLAVLMFTVISIAIFINLAFFPISTDSYVEAQIHPEVYKVFDNEITPDDITWMWQDMYQGEAGRSPVYGTFIELGLRIFGLNLFGIRIFIAIYGLIALILMFIAVKEYSSYIFSLIFTLLVGSSSWYLVYTRSGGFAGFTLINLITCLSLVALLYKIDIIIPSNEPTAEDIKKYLSDLNTKNSKHDDPDISNNTDDPDTLNIPHIIDVIDTPHIAAKLNKTLAHNDIFAFAYSLLTGMSAASLMYSYMIVRPIFLLIILFVAINTKKITLPNVLFFILPILIMFTLQFKDINTSLGKFFGARGEGMYTILVPERENFKADEFIKKIDKNIDLQIKFLLGTNQPSSYWYPNIAGSYWDNNIVIYPKFLVPFFILGAILCWAHFLYCKNYKDLIIILLFICSLIPGTLSRVGYPNLSRNSIMILPIYLFITYALYSLYILTAKINTQVKKFFSKNYIYPYTNTKDFTIRFSRNQKMCLALLITFIISTAAYQTSIYFIKDKETEKNHSQVKMYYLLEQFLYQNPNAKVLLHELACFHEYNAYVIVRLLGGENIQNKIANGQITLTRNSNLNELESLIKNNYFDAIITSDDGTLIQEFTYLKTPSLKTTQHEFLKIYYFNKTLEVSSKLRLPNFDP